ncbi:MAG: hypothetical protein WCO04_03400 [Pseudomonadota bacterium]
MRFVFVACLVSACSAYPVVQWPTSRGATPALLPRNQLQGLPPTLEGADMALTKKTADLQAWSGSVTP